MCVCVANRHVYIVQLEPDDGDEGGGGDEVSKKQRGEQFCTLFHVFYSTILSQKAVQNLREKQEGELETQALMQKHTSTMAYHTHNTHA